MYEYLGEHLKDLVIKLGFTNKKLGLTNNKIDRIIELLEETNELLRAQRNRELINPGSFDSTGTVSTQGSVKLSDTYPPTHSNNGPVFEKQKRRIGTTIHGSIGNNYPKIN